MITAFHNPLWFFSRVTKFLKGVVDDRHTPNKTVYIQIKFVLNPYTNIA